MNNDTRAFLELLDGRHTYQTFDDKKNQKTLARILHDEGELEELNQSGAGIFLMINEGNGSGRNNSAVTRVRALFADFDGTPLPRTWPLDPTTVIESSPGKYHAYWVVVDFPVDNVLFNRQQAAIANKVGSQAADVKGLSRVMRLPGYYHHKSEPFLTRIIEAYPDRIYTTSEIQTTFPLPPVVRMNPATINTRDITGLTADKVMSIMLERATDGKGRNQLGFDIACQIRDNRFTRAQCETAMIPAYLEAVYMAGDHPYTETELKDSINQAYKQPPRDPWNTPTTYRDRVTITTTEQGDDNSSNPTAAEEKPPQPLHTFKMTDLGNAERLVAHHGRDLHHTRETDWIAWDGKRWAIDATNEVERRAKHIVRSMYHELPNITDDGLRESFAKHAARSERRNSISAMVSLASSEPDIATTLNTFDQAPRLLNLQNGILNLDTFELEPNNPKYRITQLAPHAFQPDARCPNWIKFQMDINGGDPDLMRFKQKAYGYTLAGDPVEQLVMIAYGSGANGKSTELEIIREILGDYAKHADISTFAPQRRESVRNDLARLKGARFVTAIESDTGTRLNESLIKGITGGEPLTARFLNREYFEFRPQFTLWLATNHLPTITGADHGIWRRIRLIPYNVTIPPEKQDRRLREKLLAETPGILKWLIDGYRAYLSEGLEMPAIVKDATEQYQDEMDVIKQFISDCLDTTNKDNSIENPRLRRVYEWWCEQNGQRPMSARALTQALKERGFEQQKSGSRYWKGMDVQPDVWSQITYQTGGRFSYTGAN